ncbi:uncharacterized protein LOC126891098 [Diabrotica virgifera virgifera]|uniref:MULE transposase domain-containing protein n=1 Tax=Diabrotica virgifera virgifera TaxID=50390 RepID=A0ABM5L1B7_DIAVI|nr:uncharacterized protein LOC126891098 [Diabrotica virgifera virgifera]
MEKHDDNVCLSLQRIDPLCKIVSCVVVNDSQYSVELKTNFSGDCESACNDWLRKYSTETKTDWIVNRTYPKLTRIAFRKDFVCHHSKRNKSIDTSRLRNRNFDCSASLVVRVRKNTVDTTKRDVLMKEVFNAIIKIEAHHNHAVHVAEAYSYLRMSEDTKADFLKYFNEGLTPAAAKIYHETCLIASSSEEEDVTKMLADGHINPLDRSIYHFYDMWRSNHFGDRTKESMIEVIKNKNAYYTENNITVTIKEDPFIVCIVTPLMKRAHQETFSSEIIFVDSTGSCDQAGSYLTFIFGASKIGAIPLGCVIHQSQNEECYKEAFESLKQTIGETGFNGKFPAVIMTDDSAAERKALAATFPQSKLLLCSFHICQAMWRWLWDSKHNIEKSDRKPLMLAFREIVFEKDVTNTDELLNDFLNSSLLLKYPSLKEHIVGLWERKTD